MKSQEAKAAGIITRTVQHNMKRRAPWHNYYNPGIYLITIAITGRKPLLGSLCYDPAPYIDLSPLGKTILNQEAPKISASYPMINIIKICMMPDHIHMIVDVYQRLPDKIDLGRVIGLFKGGCSRVWKAINPNTDDEKLSLFEPGYNDRILLNNGQLNRWIAYLDDNPRRLALKRQNPDLFTTIYEFNICGTSCQIFGNRFLLDIPDKMAVIVHRSDSDSEFKDKFRLWMACGERGGVLIGTGIAQREKIVMREAMNRGYKLILLREMGFPEYYKPSGEAFYACVEGLLLQISPWDYHFDKRTVTRSQCLHLNALAEKIAAQITPITQS